MIQTWKFIEWFHFLIFYKEFYHNACNFMIDMSFFRATQPNVSQNIKNLWRFSLLKIIQKLGVDNPEIYQYRLLLPRIISHAKNLSNSASQIETLYIYKNYPDDKLNTCVWVFCLKLLNVLIWISQALLTWSDIHARLYAGFTYNNSNGVQYVGISNLKETVFFLLYFFVTK